MRKKPTVLAVVGPTASGKTALSIALAKRLDGEILSCDSMQIYRGMDIGTAKPTEEEKEGIPHHLIDLCDPDQPFSCAEYAREAKKVLADVLARGKTPIFCGGTGLYLEAVLSGERFSPDVPEEVAAKVAALSDEEAFRALAQGDPASAEAIHPNNVKRVRRALSILWGTGKSKTEWDALSRETESPYHAILIGLDYKDRDTLYRRIGKRVDLMLEAGLLEEAERLDLRRDCTAAQAIGYKELYGFLDGKMTLGEAKELLCRNTRNYAKRQLTWFRRRTDCTWLYPDETEEPTAENLTAAALAVYEERRKAEWTSNI